MAIFVTDFDGTMTRYDFYRMALARLVPEDTPDYWDEYLTGAISHFEALRRIFARIRGDETAVLSAARAMDPDPQAGAAATRLRAAGWELRVASAGCDWYIRRLLHEQGVTAAVFANPGAYDPAQGLRMTLPVESPYYSPHTGIDKLAVMRQAARECATVAFAGDGRPDLPAALLAPPEHRFARGWLAEALREADQPFRAFDRWSEIAEMLLA